jgi:hypothetical protein
MFFQKAMCSAIIPVCAFWTGILLAGDPTMDYASLLRVPDLSPQLTSDDVSKEFTPWTERVKKVVAGAKPDLAAIVSGARTALGTKLPQVKGIILYSLFPTDVPNLRQDEAGRADELEKLPRFQDFPILGQLNIDDVAQANRWVDFLRDQILPGGFFACDFMPRHGFRLKTADGDIDILMCYSCDQLAYFGPTKLDSEHNPVFSSATMAQINQLFDKLKIQRDIPPKTKS